MVRHFVLFRPGGPATIVLRPAARPFAVGVAPGQDFLDGQLRPTHSLYQVMGRLTRDVQTFANLSIGKALTTQSHGLAVSFAALRHRSIPNEAVCWQARHHVSADVDPMASIR